VASYHSAYSAKSTAQEIFNRTNGIRHDTVDDYCKYMRLEVYQQKYRRNNKVDQVRGQSTVAIGP